MLNTPDGGGGSEENDTNIVPFCRRGQVGSESCVDQRRAVGVCIIKNYPAKLPEQFRVCSREVCVTTTSSSMAVCMPKACVCCASPARIGFWRYPSVDMLFPFLVWGDADPS